MSYHRAFILRRCAASRPAAGRHPACGHAAYRYAARLAVGIALSLLAPPAPSQDSPSQVSASPDPASMEHVVVETNAIAYESGQILSRETEVRLDRGQFVVLIAENGDTVRVDGPFSGLPPSAESDEEINLFQALTRLIGSSTQRLAGVGGVRGPGDADAEPAPDLRPSPWLIHAERSGEQCYVRERETRFWRNAAEAGVEFEVRDVISGQSATIRWQGDGNQTGWPAGLALRDGALYTVRNTDHLSSDTTIQVFSLEPGAADSPQAAAAWLAARGCTDQARIALATLSD